MEHRAHNRVKSQSTFILQHAGTAKSANFTDISLGGALISDAAEVEAGDRVQLVIQLRSFQFLNCQATAVRSSNGKVAIQFAKPLTQEQVNLLAA